MFKVCIVGHVNFPSGVCSALKLLSGSNDNLYHFDLDYQLTHAEYEQQLTDFLKANDNVLIFADMTGGAPHQIATRLLLELGKPYQFILSSVSLNLILDLYMKNSMGVLTTANVSAELSNSMAESKEMLMVMPDVSDIKIEVDVIINEEGI